MKEDFSNIQKKMARYCAWRDRCIFEAEQKLTEMGITGSRREKILQWLQQEKYLDEERFALAFARGKFHNNRWGKIRIALELKARKIHEEVIGKALAEIPEKAYLSTLGKLAQKKWMELKEDDDYSKTQKTAAYLTRKGYENEHIWPLIQKIKNEF